MNYRNRGTVWQYFDTRTGAFIRHFIQWQLRTTNYLLPPEELGWTTTCRLYKTPRKIVKQIVRNCSVATLIPNISWLICGSPSSKFVLNLRIFLNPKRHGFESWVLFSPKAWMSIMNTHVNFRNISESRFRSQSLYFTSFITINYLCFLNCKNAFVL